jgi:NADP-dependent 3-hydroxy acid dehydrogenase YdfG
MESNLQGKIVLVTGASSGIGESTAYLAAKHGAVVAISARRSDRLRAVADKVNSSGGKAEVFEADVADESACMQLVKDVEESLGPIDVLVNNAGVMLLGPVLNAPTNEWRTMINVNVLGLMYMTHAILPGMTERKAGHIVNISSVAGRTATANSAVYNATKWAVNAFTEALRHELVTGKTGIRTTLIEPGTVATELISHNREEVQDAIKNRLAGINKRLEADDIARSIIYAISQPGHVNVNEVLIRPTEQDG